MNLLSGWTATQLATILETVSTAESLNRRAIMVKEDSGRTIEGSDDLIAAH
jgi:hypothetical protein